MKLSNPIKNAVGLVKKVYYDNKAYDTNKTADKLKMYNQVKGKNFEPGSTGFQMQSVGQDAMNKAKAKALKNKML